MAHYPLERFYQIRMAWGPTWSPDGRHMAFTSNLTGVPQIWQVPAAGGWPQPLTFGPERADGARWSPAGDAIAYLTDEQSCDGVGGG